MIFTTMTGHGQNLLATLSQLSIMVAVMSLVVAIIWIAMTSEDENHHA